MATLMKILAMAMAVQIALSDQQCKCTIKGDPHIDPFMGSHYSLPLPCAHNIVVAVTPQDIGSCILQAQGVAKYTDGLNGVSFEKLIQFSASYMSTKFIVIFDGAEIPNHTLTGYFQTLESAGITIDHSPSLGGQSTVTIGPCQVKLTYKPEESSFTLEMPLSRHLREGVCGYCNELWGGTNSPSKELILTKNLQYLNAEIQVEGEPINIYPACNNLTRSFESCKDAEVSQDICGLILEHDVRKCINKAGNSSTEALEKFEQCFTTVCFAVVEPLECTSTLQGFFYECAPQHIANVCEGAPSTPAIPATPAGDF